MVKTHKEATGSALLQQSNTGTRVTHAQLTTSKAQSYQLELSAPVVRVLDTAVRP